MSVLYLLIPLAAVLVIIGIAVFVWSVKSGQFEDLEGPGFRILMDDDEDLIPDDAKPRKHLEDAAEPADNMTSVSQNSTDNLSGSDTNPSPPAHADQQADKPHDR